MAWIWMALRLTVALVCLAAAAGKTRNPQVRREFAGFLAKVGVPGRLAAPAAAGIVAVEFGVAATAPWPVTGRLGAAVGAVLFAAFTAGAAVAVYTGRVPPCRCFGRSGTALSPVHVVRNGLLTVVAGVAAIGPAGWAPWPTAGWWLAVTAAAALTCVVLFWEDLAALITEDPLPVEAPR